MRKIAAIIDGKKRSELDESASKKKNDLKRLLVSNSNANQNVKRRNFHSKNTKRIVQLKS